MSPMFAAERGENVRDTAAALKQHLEHDQE
jgi:hypothetical protein